MTHSRVRTRIEHLFGLADECGHIAKSELGQDDLVDVNDPEVLVMPDDDYYRHHAYDGHGETYLCLLDPDGRRWVMEALLTSGTTDGEWWEELADKYLPAATQKTPALAESEGAPR